MRLQRLIACAATALVAAGAIGPLRAGTVSTDPDSPAALHQLICGLVEGAAAANRLPAAYLTRILWQESRFRSDRTSPAGAEGVAQFMPQTAVERGLADPRDPGPAITQAARLLADLGVHFGNLGLAAAAYNAGPGRVDKWLHGQGELPAETRTYVLAVTGRPVEEWTGANPAGSAIIGAERVPCLGIIADLARWVPLRGSLGPRQSLVMRAAQPRLATLRMPLDDLLAQAAARLRRELAERTRTAAAVRTIALRCAKSHPSGTPCAAYAR
jgi:hypothetical protein